VNTRCLRIAKPAATGQAAFLDAVELILFYEQGLLFLVLQRGLWVEIALLSSSTRCRIHLVSVGHISCLVVSEVLMRAAKNVEGRSTVFLWTIIVLVLIVALVLLVHLAMVNHSALTFLHVTVLGHPQTLNIVHDFGSFVGVCLSLLLDING
jgi:hypothetical protein